MTYFSSSEQLIDAVEFTLHDSFSNPVRRIVNAPYQVQEHGYAGFNIPIKITFKNGSHAYLTYDMYVFNGRDVQCSRVEKFTINNLQIPNNGPSSDTRPPYYYLPRLRADFQFVKQCLRERDLWSKLSRDEKNYCRRMKKNMKKEIIDEITEVKIVDLYCVELFL